MHLIDNHIGSGAREGENDGGCQHLAQHVADEHAVCRQRANVIEEAAVAAFGHDLPGFRQPQCDADSYQDRRTGHDVEYRAPAETRFDQAADQRAEQLCDHHDGDHEAKHAADALTRIKVADNGARHHHTSAATDGLQKSRADQLRQGRRKDTGDGGGGHEKQTRQQDGTTTEFVGQWSRQKLRTREPDHEQRDIQLNRCDVGIECLDEDGECRNENIERHRRDAVHRHKQQQKFPRCAGRNLGGRNVVVGHVVRTLIVRCDASAPLRGRARLSWLHRPTDEFRRGPARDRR